MSHFRALPSSTFCRVTSALPWVHIWPWHAVWVPRAAGSEPLPPSSLQRAACVQTRLDPARLWCLTAVTAEGIMAVGHLLPAVWENWKSTMWWTSSADKYVPKWCSTDGCSLWTRILPQCIVNTFLLWTGAELIPLTATWRGLNNFYRNLSFYSSWQELGKVSQENYFRIFWCLLKHLLIVLAISSVLKKEWVTFLRIVRCAMYVAELPAESPRQGSNWLNAGSVRLPFVNTKAGK